MTSLRTIFATVAAIGIAAGAVPAMGDEAMEKAIKARKAQMQLYSWNLGALGAMAKGQVAYDADAAKGAAGNLLALVTLEAGTLWPQGSDSTAMPGKTRAKLEAWSTWPAIGEKQTAMVDSATKLAAVAGDGLEALQGAIGPVGKSCGGCHKPYREEKK